MDKITYNIHVDPTTKYATAPTIPPDAIFKQGDLVSFTSDWPNTVIRYTNGSPFEGIEALEELEVPLKGAAVNGLWYTMKETKDIHHFECGYWAPEEPEPPETQEAQACGSVAVKKKKKVFVAWPGGGDTPRK
jgi:hypothetical protein